MTVQEVMKKTLSIFDDNKKYKKKLLKVFLGKVYKCK